MVNNGVKILLLDDEQMIVDPMARHLVRRGYTPIKTTNSQQAIEAYLKENPDICIFDISLGVDSSKNGVEVLEEIRKTNQKIPCLLLTVSSQDEDTVKKGKALGAVHLQKPCDYQIWFAKIAEIAETIRKES